MVYNWVCNLVQVGHHDNSDCEHELLHFLVLHRTKLVLRKMRMELHMWMVENNVERGILNQPRELVWHLIRIQIGKSM